MKTKLFQISAWLMVPSHFRFVMCIIFLVLMTMAVVLPGMHALADNTPGGGGH